MLVFEVNDDSILGFCEVDETTLQVVRHIESMEEALRYSDFISIFTSDTTIYDIPNECDTLKNDTGDANLGKYLRKDGLYTRSLIDAILKNPRKYIYISDFYNIGDWGGISINAVDNYRIYSASPQDNLDSVYGCIATPRYVKTDYGYFALKDYPDIFDEDDLGWMLGIYKNEFGIIIGANNPYAEHEEQFETLGFCSFTSKLRYNMRKMGKEEVRRKMLKTHDFC